MSRRSLLSRPEPPRRFSSHLRRYQPAVTDYGTLSSNAPQPRNRTNSELERLLEDNGDPEENAPDEEHADSDGIDLYGHDQWPVYDNIHTIRHEIINSIDDPYSLDQLKAPRINISVVRPLVDKFYRSQDLSIIYCLLVNRAQFVREQAYASHHQTVNLTRALLCEIVAEKILRRYNEHNPGPKGLLKLANILVAGFEPFQNAPPDLIRDNDNVIQYMRKQGGKRERAMTALEVAIISESKSFLASSACQKVVDAIYRGKLVYTPNSFIDILPDYWKKRPISLYDPRRGPLLNQYRLSVPRTRNMIEIVQFLVLLTLYLVVMEGRETRATVDYSFAELIFDMYAAGWVLDQIASMLEHGWSVYTQNLWSFLDVIFSLIFVFYSWTRAYGLNIADPDVSEDWSRLSLDALSCAAPILIPRLAFNLLSENLVFLSLRDMLANFITLVLLASWCFVGFLLTLKWLHNGLHKPVTIGKWMIWIWFGLDGTGIQRSTDFHWLLGPTVTIAFAFLGNTLFVTILVSMLSNTFSNISANAVQEMQFRRSVLTFEGVKFDALFAFMPPTNIAAVCILLPLRYVLTPRWFHKVNATTVRIINAPLLILISLYERRTLWISNRYRRLQPKHVDWSHPSGPLASRPGWWARTFRFWDLTKFSVHGDMQAVFEETPHIEDDGHEEGIGKSLREGFLKQFAGNKKPRNVSRNADSSGSKSLSASATLTQEFATDSDDADDESAPPGHQKLNKAARKDSIIDFHNDNIDLTEANARLQKLEESQAEIKALLLQILNPQTPSSADGEDVGTE